MERLRDRSANHAARGTFRVLSRALALVAALAAPAAVAGQDLPPGLAARFGEGVEALKAGRLDEAETAFRTVMREGGERAFVRHNLGIVLQQRNRHEEALVQFRAAWRLDPAFGPSRLLAGASLLALGRARGARLELGAAAKLMPHEPAVHLQLADACERLQDLLCVAEEYRTLVELSPGEPEYAYRLGRAYLRLSQWAHTRIEAIDPKAARLSQALGREYLDQGRRDLARRAFTEAIARDPGLLDVHLALASIDLEDGRLKEAAEAIGRALTLSPESRAAHELKAALQARVGR